MTAAINEATLTLGFEEVIRSGTWTLRRPFDRVLREIGCLQGVPDLVALTGSMPLVSDEYASRLASGLSRPSGALLLSLLKPRAHRTAEYLVRASGLSGPVVQRTLRELCVLDLAAEPTQSRFTLSPSFPEDPWEMWAFEVKLENWQRALFQALQYKAFAHRVVVVLPERWVHRAQNQVSRFVGLRVGLMAFDPVSADVRVLHVPPKVAPASRFHYLYAAGKFLADGGRRADVAT